MKRTSLYRFNCVLLTMLALELGGCGGDTLTPVMIIGTDAFGTTHNPATDWTAQAGLWNGKGARFNPATAKLVFESYRDDIRGGSIRPGPGDPPITAAGVTEYYVAGPGSGSFDVSGTTVLYVANADGSSPVCIGCTDAVDGINGVTVYKVLPSTATTPNIIIRQTGAAVYANQNKELATWYPDGTWIIAGIEMPRHALTHAQGSPEMGLFNDLWAISADGKTWVQLTDFSDTWMHMDSVAHLPYACAQTAYCSPGCQYKGAVIYPYDAYSCSDTFDPPPASGTMRPTLSNGFAGDVPGSAKLAWAERVGISPVYTWGGVLQIALADVIFSSGLPALVNYQRNLIPTPDQPDGTGLWFNPGGSTVIGAGYEAWSFSEDDSVLAFASDVFFSTSDPMVNPTVSPTSQAFTDAIAWHWQSPQALTNITAYDAVIYPYADNAASYPISKYGHWEEPVVTSLGAAVPFYAFASSANLTPSWNPGSYDSFIATFGLETWIVPVDRSKPAIKVTHFNEPETAERIWAYPTAFNPHDQFLYLTVVPGGPGLNPPGNIYKLGNL